MTALLAIAILIAATTSPQPLATTQAQEPLIIPMIPEAGATVTLPTGEVIVAPPGSRIEVAVRKGRFRQNPTIDRSDAAASHGVGVVAQGSEVKAGAENSAPSASLSSLDALGVGGGGSTGDGGSSNVGVSVTGAKAGPIALYVIGGLFVAGGAVMVSMGLGSIGWGCVAGGAAIIGCGVVAESYPWVYAVAAIALMGLVALLVWRAVRERKLSMAMTSVVRGVASVEQKDAGIAQRVKAEILNQTAHEDEATVRAVIRESKGAAGVL